MIQILFNLLFDIRCDDIQNLKKSIKFKFCFLNNLE